MRELVDQGTPIDATWRIITLEDQLHEAQQRTPNSIRQAELRAVCRHPAAHQHWSP